jgi:hypothetical protein
MSKKQDDQYVENERFERKGRQVVIRTAAEQTEIVIDGEVHEVRFLQNGRPMTRQFVNVMATSVRDLAERFIDQLTAEEQHYAEVAKRRAAEAKRAAENEEHAS